MHLRHNEVIQATYHRHYFPYLLIVLKVVFSSFPFYMILFFGKNELTSFGFFSWLTGITILFIFVFLYASFVYWADKLIVTNFRVVFVDWKLINVSTESEAELKDIQDIHITNKGLFAAIPFLNYGTMRVATAASEVSVVFERAPAPDKIKRFIFSIK